MIVKTTDKSRGIRLGNFVQIRDDRSTRSSKTSGPARRRAKEALDDAVKRGNELLERFQEANKAELIART